VHEHLEAETDRGGVDDGPVTADGLGALLVSARPQRKPKRDETEPPRPPLPWWAKTLGLLRALAAIITPFAVLFTRHTRKTPLRPLPGGPGSGSFRLTAPQASSSAWPVIVGMVIAIAVVLALTVLSRRRRASGAPRDRDRRLAGLLDSLAAGRGALTAGGEPREAIIACYVAMERGFAAAGSAPCWPRATSSSRTSRGWARRCWPARSRT
jgi:hypothetical protein